MRREKYFSVDGFLYLPGESKKAFIQQKSKSPKQKKVSESKSETRKKCFEIGLTLVGLSILNIPGKALHKDDPRMSRAVQMKNNN